MKQHPPWPKNIGCSATIILDNYLPKPRCTLVLGTAPWRNSCFELRRISWSPEMILTPSLQSLVRGSEGVEFTDMENSTSLP